MSDVPYFIPTQTIADDGDLDQTTDYTYDGDNNMLTMTAVVSGGTNEITHYVYGVTLAHGSAIDDNDLLYQIQYPDPWSGTNTSGGTYNQAETYKYNAHGEQTSYTDRNGTVHAYTYDQLGRLTSDSVTVSGGSGVDDTVTKLGYSYNDAGLLSTSTSYDSGGDVLNQVVETYDGFGNLASDNQAHSGSVTLGTSPSVGYSYNASNSDRLTGITYPDGRVVSYNYNGSSGLDTVLNRISSVSDTSGSLQSYSYLGLDTPVTFVDGNGVQLSYLGTVGGTSGDAGDQYSGLDRFGRVIEQNWSTTSTGAGIDQYKYTYDADSNVTAMNVVTNTSSGTINAGLASGSQTFTYDKLNQLTDFTDMTLQWTLDGLGNWDGLDVDETYNTPAAFDHNAQNQLEDGGGEGNGAYSNLGTLTYDANGNTTTDETGQTYIYDAWNRVVQITTATDTINYSYDAIGRRITETDANAGTTTDLYYSNRDQVIEEQQSGTTTTQYVWTPFYVDQMIERDDTPVSGVLTQRLYVEQDMDYNVTSITNSSGDVVERYIYDPYGNLTVLNGDAVTLGNGAASSAYNWIYLHQGLRVDVASGMYDDRARIYDPLMGRFLQEDPAGYINGPNMYQYELSNPLSGVDPTGMGNVGVLDYQSLEDYENEQMQNGGPPIVQVALGAALAITIFTQIGYDAGTEWGVHDATGKALGWAWGAVFYGGNGPTHPTRPSGPPHRNSAHSPCFPAGTLVDTEHGKVCIETLDVGDQVLSFDLESQCIVSARVVQVVATQRSDLVEIITGKAKLSVSTNHCFYCQLAPTIDPPPRARN